MRILGIETSCDDTGAAIVEDGRILANIVAAQDIHVQYGGVVLEFAKGLALARGVPWVAVNHVEAHLVSAGLESPLEAPYVVMVASRGHTEIYHVPEPGVFRRI